MPAKHDVPTRRWLNDQTQESERKELEKKAISRTENAGSWLGFHKQKPPFLALDEKRRHASGASVFPPSRRGDDKHGEARLLASGSSAFLPPSLRFRENGISGGCGRLQRRDRARFSRASVSRQPKLCHIQKSTNLLSHYQCFPIRQDIFSEFCS